MNESSFWLRQYELDACALPHSETNSRADSRSRIVVDEHRGDRSAREIEVRSMVWYVYVCLCGLMLEETKVVCPDIYIDWRCFWFQRFFFVP